MGKLLVNEWRKLFLKKSSWVMLLFIPILVVGMAVLMERSQSNNLHYMKEAYGENFVDNGGITMYEDSEGNRISEDAFWQLSDDTEYEKYQMITLTAAESVTSLEEQLLALRQQNAQDRQERIKSLEKEIAYYEVYAEKGVTPPSQRMTIMTSAGFISQLGGLYVLATIFAVIVASMMIASEFSGGTIKLLLTRPYSRIQILLSKYLMTLVYGLIATAVLVASVFGASVIFQHQSLSLPFSISTGAKPAMTIFLSLLSSNTFLMIFYITVAFFFSAVVRSQALAVGIGLGCLFSGSITSSFMPMLVEKYHWTKWLVFNLLNLNNQVLGEGYVVNGGLSILETILGMIVYTSIIAALTFYLFRRRDVALS